MTIYSFMVLSPPYSISEELFMREIPFSLAQIEALVQEHPTPFYVYDAKGIQSDARRLNDSFQSAGLDHRNFYAVKALPTPGVLKLLTAEGMGADCSSGPELTLAKKVGLSGEDIFMTSNNTPGAEYVRAAEMGAIVNFDDPTHLPFYRELVGSLPPIGCARFNPGPARVGSSIIGNPVEAKFGATREQIIAMYSQMKDAGLNRFGIHNMIASNCLEPEYFIETAKMLFELMLEIRERVGITMEFANIGGGFGIPYRPNEEPLDIDAVTQGIKHSHDEMLTKVGYPEIKIFTECGRWVTGPHGYLVTRAIHTKNTYRDFIGVDASMADLMRPGMYETAYHHISVLGKDGEPLIHTYDVVGGLCEGNDKFAKQREMPEVKAGNVLVIHDAGAHGRAMGFNYNGKLRPAEFVLENGVFRMARRAETEDDYFATLSGF